MRASAQFAEKGVQIFPIQFLLYILLYTTSIKKTKLTIYIFTLNVS